MATRMGAGALEVVMHPRVRTRTRIRTRNDPAGRRTSKIRATGRGAEVEGVERSAAGDAGLQKTGRATLSGLQRNLLPKMQIIHHITIVTVSI